MVGPVPGMSAHRLPTNVPRNMGAIACFRSDLLGRMSRKRTFVYFALIDTTWLMLFMNSAMPNRPSASATSSIPSSRCVIPNVKRSAPVSRSVPTIPSISPSTVIATPLSGEPRASVEPAKRPSNMSEQISAGPNSSATRTRIGDRKIISVMPHEAPTNDAMTVNPRATPPLPCLVIG